MSDDEAPAKKKRGLFGWFGGKDKAEPGDGEAPVSEDEATDAVAPEPESAEPERAPEASADPVEVPPAELPAMAEAQVSPAEDTDDRAPDGADDEQPPAEPDEDGRADEDEPKKAGFFGRLKAGLSRSTGRLGDGITGLFTKAKLDDETLEDLEDLLLSADLGTAAAAQVGEALAKGRYNKEISDTEVRQVLADTVADRLAPHATPLTVDPDRKPHVILMVGVNGTGKTTTIGKLAHRFTNEGKSVVLAAGDTFRAAAIEQLKIWGERVGVPVMARDLGADAAGLAFDALEHARETAADVLLIDTAGRLQNKKGLMEELAKIVRVLRKQDETAPHSVILVLDATTGQNAIAQVEAFKDVADVTGLIMTKLDGTARGGILVAVADRFDLPIHAIGVGEGIDDLQAFDPHDFAKALAGIA